MSDNKITKTESSSKSFKTVSTVLVLAVFISTLGSFLIYRNQKISVTSITLELENLPKNFDGFTIAHLSDIHNARLIEDHSEKSLVSLIAAENPDMIAITGDLIDNRHPNLVRAAHFADEMTSIAPTYYVTGNHEHRLIADENVSLFTYLEPLLLQAGVEIMENRAVKLSRDSESIAVAGLSDAFNNPYFFKEIQAVADYSQKLSDVSILLSHRPEHFGSYAAAGFDLTLAGHAHGGQIRLPFVGGLVAPNQGFLPQLTEGITMQTDLEDNPHYLVVSRGIGNSIFPLRINNDPELIIITLVSAKKN